MSTRHRFIATVDKNWIARSMEDCISLRDIRYQGLYLEFHYLLIALRKTGNCWQWYSLGVTYLPVSDAWVWSNKVCGYCKLALPNFFSNDNPLVFSCSCLERRLFLTVVNEIDRIPICLSEVTINQFYLRALNFCTEFHTKLVNKIEDFLRAWVKARFTYDVKFSINFITISSTFHQR